MENLLRVAPNSTQSLQKENSGACLLSYLQGGSRRQYMLLWRCEATREVWSACLKRLQKCYLPQLSMLQLFEAIQRTMNSQTIQEFVIVASKIWWRNCFIFKEEFAHLSVLVREAQSMLEMLAEEAPSKALSSSKSCISVNTWQAPLERVQAELGWGIRQYSRQDWTRSGG